MNAGIVRTDTFPAEATQLGMASISKLAGGIMAMIPAGAIVGTIAGSAMFAALLQVGGVDQTMLTQIGTLGTTSLLAAAVIVLWRKLSETQAQLMTLYKEGADESAARRAALEKMVETLAAIKEAVGHRKA